LTAPQKIYPQKGGVRIGRADENIFYDLAIVGQMGVEEISHQKRVQKINELMDMQMERKKRVKELMAKREGTFHEQI
jgi:hypothetical protein